MGYLNENWTLKGIGAGLIVVMFFVLLFIPGSFHQVDTGEVAVVKHKGVALEETKQPGISFAFWMTNTYIKYYTKVRELAIETPSFSSDNQTMDISLKIFYQIDGTKATNITKQFGSMEQLENKIERLAEEGLKNILSQYRAENIIASRQEVIKQINEEIKDAVNPSTYYTDITSVVLTNIDFTDEFEKSVEDKVIAEQRAKQAEYEQEQKVIEAKAKLEVAKLEAEAAIERAKGDAEALEIAAKAEANALKLKSIEAARMLGFKIIETTIYEKTADGTNAKDKDGKDIVLGTQYEIDFTEKSADQIKVIEEYLKYIAYLEKWDGKLPDVVGGDNLDIFVSKA